MEKQKLIVLYGGKSPEHEISRRSAKFIFENFDRKKYDAYFFALDFYTGSWYPQPIQEWKSLPLDMLELPIEKGYSSKEHTEILEMFNPSRGEVRIKEKPIVFSIVHGNTGEDGKIQALCELLGLPYVGSSMQASVCGMDKILTKKILQTHKIPMGKFLNFDAYEWKQNHKKILKEISSKLGPKVFVKPSRLGSSVGITFCKTPKDHQKAIELALQYDERILVEKALQIREVECAVIGQRGEYLVAEPGELVAESGFYDYDTKYLKTNQCRVDIPAKLKKSELKQAKELAVKVYQFLGLEGFSRVDLFYEIKTKKFYFNEVNTVPGFTRTSFFPLLWEHAGVGARDLIDKLIQFAVGSFEVRSSFKQERN